MCLLSVNAFLALLDYVSRAHEIKICPPSSVSQLSLNLMHGFLSNFICGFSWTIRTTNFFFFFLIFFYKRWGVCFIKFRVLGPLFPPPPPPPLGVILITH